MVISVPGSNAIRFVSVNCTRTYVPLLAAATVQQKNKITQQLRQYVNVSVVLTIF